MRTRLITCLSLATALISGSGASSLSAQTGLVDIPGLFGTGVDASGQRLLAENALDPHYQIISRQNYYYPSGPAGLPTAFTPTLAPAVVDRNNGPCTGLDTWYVSANSCWIWFDKAASSRDVTYIFRLSFDLTGLDHTTATMSGYAAADDFFSIFLNGAQIAQFDGPGLFSNLHSFNTPVGFIAGLNHLDFAVAGTGYADGLLVERLTGQAAVLVPEPAVAILLALPLLILGAGARRRHTRS